MNAKTRAAIKEAKRLERDMIKYGLRLSKSASIAYVDAVRVMKDQPDAVAKEVGASVEFVVMWTTMELRRKQ